MPNSRTLVYYSDLSPSGFSPQLYSMKPCEIKGKEWLNPTSEQVIASGVTGERNSVEKSSKGAFCEGVG